MVITSGNCIVPFALWNSHCPQHAISCVLMTKDKKHLITGGCDGRIINWKVGKDFQVSLNGVYFFSFRVKMKNLTYTGAP